MFNNSNEILNEIHLKYKSETGNRPIEEVIEIGVVRMRGLWVLDPDEINDDEILRLFSYRGELIVTKPDQDYIEWLEEQITTKL